MGRLRWEQSRRLRVIPSVARDLSGRWRQDRSSRPLPPRSFATLGKTEKSPVFVTARVEEDHGLAGLQHPLLPKVAPRHQSSAAFRPRVDPLSAHLARRGLDAGLGDRDGAAFRITKGAKHQAIADRAGYAQSPRGGLGVFPLGGIVEALLE